MAHPKIEIEGKFEALWKWLSGQPSLKDIDLSVVQARAEVMSLTVHSLEIQKVGSFWLTPAIVLSTEENTACFPLYKIGEDPDWVVNLGHMNRVAALWEKMEWFSPLWVAQDKIGPLLKDVMNCDRESALRQFEYHMSTIYTVGFQAVCIAQLLPKSRILAEFVPLIREAYLGFYSGSRASSIAALIPIFEGAIKRIAGAGNDAQILHEIDKVVDRAIDLAAKLHFDEQWVPSDYRELSYLFSQDERVFIFETFRRWLKSSFFQDTRKYDGLTWLNRHLFAHGMSSKWQDSANFMRLVVAISTLGVIESWHDNSNQVSLFFPVADKDGELLWQQALLRLRLQEILVLHEVNIFHQQGRLVPELPTDDGVMLRAAVLAEDCIKDVVRPLRDAGWSVDMDEPDELAMYALARAKSGEETFTVAFLFSCDSDNELYKELASKADAIVYRGPPYKQGSFAQGINVHVGPAAGWLPPRPQRSPG
ncbi:hypothetical protein C798_23550 [Herbaspirillum rubrisubalbicans Os34]|uniref:Uncharacterized protein n=1 Tax=Herbaspirillum rubrisubalbicans Os34 TaxID=1235827 RepID=A0A6M3ZWN6_9BURK|nr:hypothetical protein [Herbaspirillum rubrisubalbicans]QJQ03095.1 hypothetical protein C798_23550 [Herbaspirillum rubrisubalbicans Os34]